MSLVPRTDDPTSHLLDTPSPDLTDAKPQDDAAGTPAGGILGTGLSRRGFLRGAAITGGGIVAATLAACAPATPTPGWTYGPLTTTPPSGGPTPVPPTSAPSASPTATATPAPSGNVPAGYSSHDVDARNIIRRYIGNLAPALQGIYGDDIFKTFTDMLNVEDNYPELQAKPAFAQMDQLILNDVLKPLTPELDGDVKVFRLTVDQMDQKIDEMRPPVAALGYNKQWPGPTIRAKQGDKLRVLVTNNLDEATSVHFHGVEFDDFRMDGVPFVTQKPIVPGQTWTYEFTAKSTGSLMYHSHHNATDQVGRGLLGAFIVEPKDDVKVDRDYIWISNDALGGFTINGHGFPAVVPVLAAVGETVRLRFMNEGTMMHPWHLHGFAMKIVARDGRPLGSAAFECDTIGVNPGERFDALVKVDRPGVWAFHCHILPHVEGINGMFGMVNTLIVVPKKEHVDAIVQALIA